jgi:L-alanine-DL-glutamate epimerase-like enolase superfamily enzyme
MTEIAMLFAEIETKDGHKGLGLSYSKRAGGPGQFAHAKEIAPALIGEDPGGITPFLRIAAQAEQAGLMLGPHFAMELHVHLGAVYATEPWVEHFDWLEPLFDERLESKGGRMLVPTRPGLGLTLSDQARTWTREKAEIGTHP